LIKLKAGVDMKGIQPELTLALVIVDQVFEDNGIFDTVITSMKDGTHKPGSWHYSGWAADLRSKHIGALTQKNIILEKMKQVLGAQWEVFLEYPNGNNEHYHIEPSPQMKAEK